MSVTNITKTTFLWLDASQRKEFKRRWEIVKSMHEKWFWSGHIDLGMGKKTLEDEIRDLENLSMAAYKALKLLKKQLEENDRDDEYR